MAKRSPRGRILSNEGGEVMGIFVDLTQQQFSSFWANQGCHFDQFLSKLFLEKKQLQLINILEQSVM